MSKVPKTWRLGTERLKVPIRYTGCGLDDIWLASGYDMDEIDGEQIIRVRNLDGLIEAIGRSLVTRKKLLTGKEIRFLRTQMDMSQSRLARLVGCDAQQIARYEKSQSKMHGAVDRILRMLYREHLEDPIGIQAYLDAVDKLDGRMRDAQVFAETPEGWKAAQ